MEALHWPPAHWVTSARKTEARGTGEGTVSPRLYPLKNNTLEKTKLNLLFLIHIKTNRWKPAGFWIPQWSRSDLSQRNSLPNKASILWPTVASDVNEASQSTPMLTAMVQARTVPQQWTSEHERSNLRNAEGDEEAENYLHESEEWVAVSRELAGCPWFNAYAVERPPGRIRETEAKASKSKA